jgi:SAM-dependent methyltransferase
LNRPVAIGYVNPDAYLAQNERRNAEDAKRRFSLGFALARWQAELPRGLLSERFGTSPRCLIQGSASPDNVDALVAFLRHQGIAWPEIHVIDLIDLEALGHIQKPTRFHRADAADLSQFFADASFDLVLQDHLLNCAPVGTYQPILGELRRILHPGGLALLHYTDPSEFPPAEGEALRDRLGPDGDVHNVRLSAAECDAFIRRGPARRLVAIDDGVVMVTLPSGNLEHFISFEAFEDLLGAAGLAVRQRHIVRLIDGEGLACRRNHCLVEPRAL